MNIFDLAKLICTKKTPWEELSEEDQKAWNPYMINRILSMNPDYLELVDHIQLRSNMSPEMVYKTYCDLLPVGYRYMPFVKGSSKLAEVKAVAEHYGVSRREAREYIKLLSKEVIIDLVAKYDEEPFESHKIKKSKSK